MVRKSSTIDEIETIVTLGPNKHRKEVAMADTGRKRGEIAEAAFNLIVGEAIAKKASIVRIFSPRHTIYAMTGRGGVEIPVPECVDDMIGLIKLKARLNTTNADVVQIGRMKPLWRREFFLPLYIVVKVIPGDDKKDEEIRLHIA